jgi:PAS domain S-box-containing protein
MNPLCVLVVEDNPITRKMLCYALQSDGYDAPEAGDGRGALEAAAERHPDLLVLDYMLPDMNGLELLDQVRRQSARPDLPAIVVTGMMSRLEEFRASSGLSTQFMVKPVEPSRLLEAIRAQFQPSESHASGGRRVLVVDDEPLNRKLASFRLKQAGYEVDVAAGGAEALEVARRRPPDAILSDVLMPSMDGFAFCRQAREDPVLARVPIVLVSSSYVDTADQELARKMGATALVPRTADLGEAMAALEAGLHGGPPPPTSMSNERLADLHRERLQVQLDRQTARNDALLRQAAVHATALSMIRGLSEVLAQPRDATTVLSDVLLHCLDAAGLSTGVLYLVEGGRHRLRAQFGLRVESRADAERCFGHGALIQRLAEARQPVALSAGDAEADAETREFLSRLGYSSALVLPFVVLGELFGELVLASDSHDLSESAWIGFARSLSQQFGQTVALGQSLRRLATSEGRYRALLEQANDAILTLEADQRILEANLRTEQMLGRPRDEIVGRRYQDFLVPDERDDAVRLHEQLLSGGTQHVANRHLLRPDGSRLAVEVSSSVARLGDESAVLTILHDVTERQRAQEALREAQRRLQHVVSSSPAVLFTLKPEGDGFAGTWVSANVERLLGFTPEEALGREWWSSQLHPDDRERVLSEMASLITYGQLTQEYRLRNRRGEYRWLRAEMRLMRDGEGNPLEAIGSWADVSARKLVEGKLQESEEQYRLLFDSNPHPMYVHDAATLAFMAVNDAAIRHYGWSRDEFLRMTMKDIRPVEEVPVLLKTLEERSGDRGATNMGLFKHSKKDGTVIQAEVARSPLRFQGREAWLVLALDVTEKRSLEAQLLQAQKMESIGRLAGGVAHDFNNILGVITGCGELLRKRLPDDPRMLKYADDILKAAYRAAGLTRQLLAFSRKQVLQPRVLDLNAVVADMERMLRRLIGEDVELVTILAKDAPHVRADAGQLEQVLMNLAVNARDAMPRGGRLLIETGTALFDEKIASTHPDVSPGRYAVLAVGDTGHGMTPEVQARIFEPFFTTKEAGKGTGLGLATVHGVVRQSGGHIFVRSEPGRGSAFEVYLPAVEESPRESPSRPVEEAPGGSETILLAEDEGGLREIIREYLESRGYTVLPAPHGLAALELSARHAEQIHLLITDVVMPGLGGAELWRRLLAQRPGMKVLFLSGHTDDAVILHGVQAQETAFLAKPFTVDTLARKIREALNQGQP